MDEEVLHRSLTALVTPFLVGTYIEDSVIVPEETLNPEPEHIDEGSGQGSLSLAEEMHDSGAIPVVTVPASNYDADEPKLADTELVDVLLREDNFDEAEDGAATEKEFVTEQSLSFSAEELTGREDTEAAALDDTAHDVDAHEDTDTPTDEDLTGPLDTADETEVDADASDPLTDQTSELDTPTQDVTPEPVAITFDPASFDPTQYLTVMSPSSGSVAAHTKPHKHAPAVDSEVARAMLRELSSFRQDQDT